MSDEPWPVWATEPIEIVAPDPRWAERAAALIIDLEHRLERWLTGVVEHIGSTAVPGLAAKPILDLQAPVAELAVDTAVAAELAGDGWHLVPPDLDDQSWRRLLVHAPDGRHRRAHLHLAGPDDAGRMAAHRRFRDRLRAEPATRDAYAAFKRRLATELGDDREAYTDAKAAFITETLEARSEERDHR